MKTSRKNAELAALIEKAQQAGIAAPFWKAVARSLNRPRRVQFCVDIADLSKNGSNAVLVPGNVLGNGDMDKELTVAALRFTQSAASKIKKAGGEAISIAELLERSPKGAKVMLMG
ncbi:MAG: 50S ribosomal protein L18e [Candidatus Aenigmarchaeota archaeon]|nr:50S ribosomal protein L18e [Candidatus Aenigmarchaeota archaeon]